MASNDKKQGLQVNKPGAYFFLGDIALLGKINF